MKRSLTAFLFVVLLIPLQPGHATDLTLLKETFIQVYFSPDGGSTNAISKVLGQARQEILEKSQRTQKYSSATFLKNSRIPTFIDDKHAIAHNKIHANR